MKVTLLSFSEINKQWFLQALSERKDNICLCHLVVNMWINSCLHEQSYCTDKIIVPNKSIRLSPGCVFYVVLSRCRLLDIRLGGVVLD